MRSASESSSFCTATRARRVLVWRAILDVALGVAASGYAVRAGTRRRSARSGTPSRTTAWLHHRLEHLTTSRAALIGLVTHLPGLIYLAALDAIVRSAATPLNAVIQVVIYNIIWYGVAIAAFLISVFRPAASKGLLERADAIVHRHGRWIVVAVFGIIGVYLLGKGISVLRGW